MSESKYLLVPAEGNLDEGLTMRELFAAHLPNQMKEAARYRMMVRLATENFDGPMDVEAQKIANEVEDKHGDAMPDSEKLTLVLDALIERFPETE